MKTINDRSLSRDEWEALRYPVKLYPLSEEEGGGWLATIPLLGEATCVADGETVEEALEALEAYRRSLYDHLAQSGVKVPLPPARPDEAPLRPSGKWVQRAPSDLHAELQNGAKTAGVSFNTYCLTCLERGHHAGAAETALREEFAHLKTELVTQLSGVLRREVRDEVRLQIHATLGSVIFERTRAAFENAQIQVERPTAKSKTKSSTSRSGSKWPRIHYGEDGELRAA